MLTKHTVDETVHIITEAVRNNSSLGNIKTTEIPRGVFEVLDRHFSYICHELKCRGVKVLGIDNDFHTRYTILTA